MKETNVVFFEHIRLYGTKLGILLALWAMIPFLSLLFVMIPSPFTVVLGIIGFIAFIVLCVYLIIYTINRSKTVYKLFPGCPAKYRFDESVAFDFETVPGEVRCQLISSEKSGKFYTIQSIEYDEVTKVFKFVISSGIIIVPGGATGVYATSRYFTGVVGAPDSEELMRLLKEHHISFKSFDTEMAYYVVAALNEKR